MPAHTKAPVQIVRLVVVGARRRQHPSHDRAQSKDPLASQPAGLSPFDRYRLALAVAATEVLIELLDRKRLGARRSNNASKERQGDKRGYDGLHGHSPEFSESISAIASVFASGDMTVTRPPRSVAGHKAMEKGKDERP